MLETIGIGKDILSTTAAAQQLRERMDKRGYMKLISFCTTKEMVSKLKKPPTELEKIDDVFTSVIALYSSSIYSWLSIF
jgi:hypothetical protein